MIIIKDKEKNTQLMLPRNGNLSGVDVIADYVTTKQLENYQYVNGKYVDKEINTLQKEVENNIAESTEQILEQVNEMINVVLGDINNELEEILA